MAALSTLMFTAYFAMVFIGAVNALINYEKRLLIKSNFWINVMSFCLIAFTTLIILLDLFSEE